MSAAGPMPSSALPLPLRWLWDLPRLSLIGALIAYRRLVSPLYGQVCRFFPSCSAYALEAITIHGAVRGSWLAIRRLSRCHPWNSGGIDHVPAGRHDHAGNDAVVPLIVKLNHPDRFLTDHLDAKGRAAA
jgi:uncharacterized protein